MSDERLWQGTFKGLYGRYDAQKQVSAELPPPLTLPVEGATWYLQWYNADKRTATYAKEKPE